MPKTKKKKKLKHYWLLVGLASILISAPNITAIKLVTNSMDANVFNTWRFMLIAIVATPALLLMLRTVKKRALHKAFIGSAFMTIAIVSTVWAVKLGQASYVSIIFLLSPIALVVMSVTFGKERLKSRALLGVALAALGAMLIVALPVAVHQQGEFTFNPVSTILAVIGAISFAGAVVYYKMAAKKGVSVLAQIGLSAWVITIISAACALALQEQFTVSDTPSILLILYSGLGVALFARLLNVISYEHVGAAVTSSLAYLENLIAIIIPVIILGEKLSVEMVLGGMFIILGLFVIEHHKFSHHKHYHVHRHH